MSLYVRGMVAMMYKRDKVPEGINTFPLRKLSKVKTSTAIGLIRHTLCTKMTDLEASVSL